MRTNSDLTRRAKAQRRSRMNWPASLMVVAAPVIGPSGEYVLMPAVAQECTYQAEVFYEVEPSGSRVYSCSHSNCQDCQPGFCYPQDF